VVERDEDGQGTVWDKGFWECVRRMEANEREEAEKRRLELSGGDGV
jgi:hypothetical protein